MSYTPIPVIPQTPEQAVQRDQAVGGDIPLVQTVEAELAVLRNAIAEHRDTMETAGPLGLAAEFTDEQQHIMTIKHQADRTCRTPENRPSASSISNPSELSAPHAYAPPSKSSFAATSSSRTSTNGNHAPSANPASTPDGARRSPTRCTRPLPTPTRPWLTASSVSSS